MKKILCVAGAILLSLPSLSLSREALFPHQIFVDGKLMVQLEKLSEAIKIEVRELKMKMDPTGSITISSQENWINIKIDPKGSISHTSTLLLSLSPEKIGKEITGINRISLKSDDLGSGEIELVLKEKLGVNKKDLLLLPLVWKIGKRGYRTVVEKKETISIERYHQ